MALDQTQEPACEPVGLPEALNYCRVDPDLTEELSLVKLLLSAARRYAEHYTARSLITQKWRLTLDGFPGAGLMGMNWRSGYAGLNWRTGFLHPGPPVLLERGKVQKVDSIAYTATDGTTVTISNPAAPNYAIDLSGPVARLTPGFGYVWPIPLPQIGCVRIDYTAGYGDTPDTIPEGIRDWILMRVKSRFDMRGEVAAPQRGKIEPLPWVDGLLDPYRIILM